MALPSDPGPGANPLPPRPPEYPPPLDLTVRVPGAPHLVRMGPCFEWDGGQLVMSWLVPGGQVSWRKLEPEESRRLFEWFLKSAEIGGS